MLRKSRAWVAVFLLVCGGSLAAVSSGVAADADVYLSPLGNDQWSGKLAEPNADGSDGPLASFAAAQRVVRLLKQQATNRSEPIVVALRGGSYWLDDSITFRPEDSGTAEAPVVYQAFGDERPILSGGQLIQDWKVADGRWQAVLPDVKRGDWQFTQLFVNDQRRFRPRLPKEGYYHITKEVEPSAQAGGKGHDRFGYKPGEISPNWTNLDDVEVMAFHLWAASRMHIASIDDQANVITLKGHTTGNSNWAQFNTGHRFFVENVKEALDEPGQWYLDRTEGILTYIPRNGETPQNTAVVAPRLRNLLLLKGDVEQRQWVQYIQFRGLTFAHSKWTTPQEGQSFPQAEINLGAAVAAMATRHVLFDNCAVRHTGEYAIAFGPGSRHNRVEGCELVDMAAGGIKIGHALPTTWGNTLGPPGDPEAVVSHHTVKDCLIAHGGRLHPAAIGVWVGHSPYNVVQHNEVYDFYYTAFSFGWVWGYRESLAHHNDLGFNHAHHIGQSVLSDMGCVYTLGVSPGTVIHDNHFHDVISYDYGGWGLYTDEGSSGIVMKNNLVYRCSRGGFHQHYGKENRVENNILAFGGQHQLQRSRKEDHISFFFERNIVYWDNDSPLLGSNWGDDQFRLDYNLYWRAGKPVTFPGNLTLEQWQAQRSQDRHSVIADPGFVDPGEDDFTLKPDSPALKLGFQPFDVSRAGRHRPLILTRDLPPVPAGFPSR